MERLKNHKDFVRVLRLRHKVSSADVVVHFLVRDVSVIHELQRDDSVQDDSVKTLEGTEGDSQFDAENDVGSTDSIDEIEVHHRVGLAVSKAVGNAVVRNRVKRRFRELARAHEDLLPNVCDIVIRAKPSVVGVSYAILDRQIQHLFSDITRKSSAQINDVLANGAVVD